MMCRTDTVEVIKKGIIVPVSEFLYLRTIYCFCGAALATALPKTKECARSKCVASCSCHVGLILPFLNANLSYILAQTPATTHSFWQDHFWLILYIAIEIVLK